MFGNQSPFNQQPEITLPEGTEIVFVSDLFAEDYVGGAELTSEALIEKCPFQIFKLRARDVSLALLEQGQNCHWIFGNYTHMKHELIPSVVANISYSILEYDYKYSKWRSPQKHEAIEGVPCDDANTLHGKMISAFMFGARSLWYMSEAQMNHYHETFPFLEEKPHVVLSSVFDDRYFAAVNVLNEQYKDVERKGWIVLGSTSWVKGADAAEQWCKDNNKEYEVIWGLPYDQVLEKLAQAEGFVYLPAGWDTCPRMVIEAKMLGCKLELNDNVQHKDEIWFDTEDPFDTEAYLYAARERFWNGIREDMNWTPSISGYTTTLNCIKHNYPWRESIKSLLGFCDEVVVVDGGSDDGTWSELRAMAKDQEGGKLKVFQVERDWDHPRFAVFDGAQKAEARQRCTMDYLWQQDADEVVHENDYEKIRKLCASFPGQVDLVALPVIEYWGGEEKVRMDVNPWKWRLSRNMPHITHGIPKMFRKEDDDGNLYAAPGTDGCDYVHVETHEVIPHASFYTNETHVARIQALAGNEQTKEQYEDWFDRCTQLLPSVHHYSWFDLPRKIRTYRDYWSQHWQSLYNIEQQDTADNNMFFGKPWTEVTEQEIEDLSKRLASEMGGWIFHSPVDFNKPTPHLTLKTNHPAVMEFDNE